jgi:hypothetical protein
MSSRQVFRNGSGAGREATWLENAQTIHLAEVRLGFTDSYRETPFSSVIQLLEAITSAQRRLPPPLIEEIFEKDHVVCACCAFRRLDWHVGGDARAVRRKIVALSSCPPLSAAVVR